jgi:hypothetical protein
MFKLEDLLGKIRIGEESQGQGMHVIINSNKVNI